MTHMTRQRNLPASPGHLMQRRQTSIRDHFLVQQLRSQTTAHTPRYNESDIIDLVSDSSPDTPPARVEPFPNVQPQWTVQVLATMEQGRCSKAIIQLCARQADMPHWGLNTAEALYIIAAAPYYQNGKYIGLPTMTESIARALRTHLDHDAQSGDLWPPLAIFLIQQEVLDANFYVDTSLIVEDEDGLFLQPGARILRGLTLIYPGTLRRYHDNSVSTDKSLAIDEHNWYIDAHHPVFVPYSLAREPAMLHLSFANKWIWEDISDDFNIDSRFQV